MNKEKFKELINGFNEGTVKAQSGCRRWVDGKREDTYTYEDLEEGECPIALLLDEEYNVILGGEEFKHIMGYRENEDYYWIAHHIASDTYYMWSGWYDSWSGAERDSDSSFTQVEKATKTIEYWKSVV